MVGDPTDLPENPTKDECTTVARSIPLICKMLDEQSCATLNSKILAKCGADASFNMEDNDEDIGEHAEIMSPSDIEDEDSSHDVGASVGRRGGMISTSGSFRMSSAGANRAGNDEEEFGEADEDKMNIGTGLKGWLKARNVLRRRKARKKKSMGDKKRQKFVETFKKLCKKVQKKKKAPPATKPRRLKKILKKMRGKRRDILQASAFHSYSATQPNKHPAGAKGLCRGWYCKNWHVDRCEKQLNVRITDPLVFGSLIHCTQCPEGTAFFMTALNARAGQCEPYTTVPKTMCRSLPPPTDTRNLYMQSLYPKSPGKLCTKAVAHELVFRVKETSLTAGMYKWLKPMKGADDSAGVRCLARNEVVCVRGSCTVRKQIQCITVCKMAYFTARSLSGFAIGSRVAAEYCYISKWCKYQRDPSACDATLCTGKYGSRACEETAMTL